jgi:hypothetical protein
MNAANMYSIAVRSPKGSLLEAMSADTDEIAFAVYESTCYSYGLHSGYTITLLQRNVRLSYYIPGPIT